MNEFEDGEELNNQCRKICSGVPLLAVTHSQLALEDFNSVQATQS